MSREDLVTHTPPFADRIMERDFAMMLNKVSDEANQQGFEAMRRLGARTRAVSAKERGESSSN